MFNGPAYQPELDFSRLISQNEKIKSLMLDGVWRTLKQIAAMTGFPEGSVSAQLRHLRKIKFGAYLVERRSCGDRAVGLFEYRIAGKKEEFMQGKITGYLKSL